MMLAYHARRHSYQRLPRFLPIGSHRPSAEEHIMTAFQAIRATIDMLLARARQPIGSCELIPAPSVARHQHARAEHSTESERAAQRHADADR